MVKVNSFGKRVSYPQKVHQFRKRVMAEHAMFFEIDDKAAIVQDERLEKPRIVVLRGGGNPGDPH